MKKIRFIMLALSLVFVLGAMLVSCGGEACTEHKDADGNGSCDECDEAIPLLQNPTEVNVEFTLKDQDGAAVSGVEICFAPRGAIDAAEKVYAKSGTDGRFSVKLKSATYFLSVDYDADQIGDYLLSTTKIKVTKDTSALDIIMTNNNPNGTVQRPYPLSFGSNSFTVPAGKTNYYVVYRAANFIAEITAEDVKAAYNGAEYTPDANSVISFKFAASDDFAEIVAITATGSEDAAVLFNISSAPGSISNPFVITELGSEISESGVAKGDGVYYSYTAARSGRLVLSVRSEYTHAAMQNGSSRVSTVEENSTVISFDVSSGDEVVINIKSNAEQAVECCFTLELLFTY